MNPHGTLKSLLRPFGLCFALVSLASAQSEDPVSVQKKAPVTRLSPMAAQMKWIGKAVDDPDYYVWCTAPIQSKDGKIHLFCSRWPKQHKMGGWMTHSEIAHYVGDQPEGPFRFADLSIPSNPGAPWMNSIHNPAITQVGDTFVLLFITFDKRPGSPTGGGKMLTGMATSKSLSGPWKLQGEDGQIVKPSENPSHWTHNPWAMDNPTFLADPKTKKFYIYFKSAQQQRKSQYGYAVSDKIEGPYQLSDKPCTDNRDYIEDATAFQTNGKYYLLTNDNYGTHTGVAGRGILWSSDTPTNFRLADAQIGFLKTSDYAKGLDLSKASKLYGGEFKFERPGVLLIKGKPAYFYGPSGVNLEGADHTCSYVMKIDWDQKPSR